MSNNIILIGFMGVGKDAIGRELAKKMEMAFLSTDEFIELKEQRTINTIFKESGEAYFRQLEKETVAAIKTLENTVIATGGGMVIDEQNRHDLSKMGKVVQCDAQIDIIEERLKDCPDRPLLKSKKDIRKIYEARRGMYNFGKLKIDTSFKDPAERADEIIKKLHMRYKSRAVPRNTITVQTVQKSYPIYIGSTMLSASEDFVRLLDLNASRAIVITNPLVGALYLQSVENTLRDNGIEPIHIIVPDGESHKTLRTAEGIYDFLLENKITRSEPIIALGGGVICDLCGFVASTYKRGTPLIMLPSSLLAQVDAAIGGKTGIDHKLGKNMIGTFYQPDVVISDVAFLLSLSENELRNGLAEVLKYAIIKDKSLFSLLETNQRKITERDVFLLAEIISRCAQIKARIVEEDEKEEIGVREILNYGHTIGHIIETLTNYSEFSHGAAVAIGMVEESKMAVKNGFLKKNDLARIINLISSFGLPTEMPENVKNKDVRKIILQDKKIRDGKMMLPIPEEIGRVILKEVTCNTFL
jgi:shikimate kinase/3-dehydroquinate synthase